MLSDIVRPNGISCSNIPGLTASVYGVADAPGSSAGVLTVLDSVTLPANAFSVNGDFMDLEYSGVFFGDADTEVNVSWVQDSGSGDLFTSGIQDPAAQEWILRGRVVRYSEDRILVSASLICGAFRVVSAAESQVYFTEPMQVKIKGVGTTADSVKLYAGFRQFFFQNR